MEEFLNFVVKAKQALNNFEGYKNVHLVLGNESCDLDSTVSALALAYLIHVKTSRENTDCLVIPVMNVCAKYFPLRTETCYVLKEAGINSNNLVFRDQIDYSCILNNKTVQTTIVDHHVLSQHDKVLEKTVVEIFDHRPINSEEICQNQGLRKTIKIVGSCSTLIAHEIINSKLPILFNELCYLLYATIIYDTIGLNKDSGKTFDDDVTAAEHLEKTLNVRASRQELFGLLWKIHNDTSNLGTKELLYRDLKVIQGIPMPGLPMLVENYLKREDADSAIQSFASEFDKQNVVLVGIDAGGEVKRDIGIFFTDPVFKDSLVALLKSSKHGSDLELCEIAVKNKDVVCFRQGNIKLSRKFILPLVNEAALHFFKDN